MSDKVFIAGASVRSMAQSAVRAGLQVTAADLFGDRDIPPECVVCRVENYPHGILEVAHRIPPRVWSYTGGLENYPDLVEAVSRRHELLGNSAETLRRVRDPWQLRQVLGRAQIDYPEILADPPSYHPGAWLRKPRRSCGGMHIGVVPRGAGASAAGKSGSVAGAPNGQRTSGMPEETSDRDGGYYYQRRIRGSAYGAVYVARRGNAVLLGVTRQLIGCSWAGASGLRYTGSVGPVDLGPSRTALLQRIGDCLTTEFSLRGLFGVDIVVSGPRIWVIEINPRFTASVEILERAKGFVAMALHRAACNGLPLNEPGGVQGGQLHAKAIVFARCTGTVDAEFYRALESEPSGEFPSFADLPHEGTTIAAGHPILTVFARGDKLATVLHQLRGRAVSLRRRFS